MSQKGIITAVAPKGNYQSSQGKTIYTFFMTVKFWDDKEVTGEIGSTKNVYPMNVGDEIDIDVTVNEHGTRLKKINPKPSGDSGSGGGSRGGGSGYKKDTPEEIFGKCLFGLFVSRLTQMTAIELSQNNNELEACKHLVRLCMDKENLK